LNHTTARWISIVAHPFVMMIVMVGVVAARYLPFRDALEILALVVLFAIAPTLILMCRQVQRGKWGNVDASNLRERPLLYLVGSTGIVALVGYLLIRHPNSFLLRGAVVALALIGVCALATVWVKVSLHVAAATMTAAVLILTGSFLGWIIAIMVPLLMWSRLALGRHKPVEVGLGFFLGLVAGILATA
jgi:hypothetical protein